jgi:hypothetical protein
LPRLRQLPTVSLKSSLGDQRSCFLAMGQLYQTTHAGATMPPSESNVKYQNLAKCKHDVTFCRQP